MKSFKMSVICLLVVVGLVVGYFLGKNLIEMKRISNIKKGWYIEIIYDPSINVRTLPSTKGKLIGKANKGEVYKVIDINLDDKSFYWYQVKYGKWDGWIASGRKNHWVKDVNNPNDIAIPEIVFKESSYKVKSINDINYKHLEIIEDTDDYTITHVVYHEYYPNTYIDQYWINYTVTDGAGKSSSKMQKIEFIEKPDESQVKDFSEYKK